MSYTINRYNGNAIATVVDGTINNTLDITLIGKNYAGYGQSQNENFVYLLENFANSTRPPSPLSGQIWYDTTTNKLRFYDGQRFRAAGSAEAAPSTAPPAGLALGDFWWDSTNQQLNISNGSGTFTTVGPFTSSTNSGSTQFQINTVSASPSGSYPIIQAVLGGSNTVFTVSNTAFSLNTNISSSNISGFTTNGIFQGITLNSLVQNTVTGIPVYTTRATNYKFWGTASDADALGGVPAANYVTVANASFSNSVNFSGTGFSVNQVLGVQNQLFSFLGGQQTTTPIISSSVTGVPLVFTTKTGSTAITTLQLLGNVIHPGVSGTTTLGTNTSYFNNLYSIASTLLPVGAQPSAPTAGQMAVANGTSWNPASDGLQHLMIYINSTWTKVI
jgi:hypothetical protein